MILDEWVQQTLVNDALMVERRIQLVIQPKPRWLPKFAWERILRRLLVIREAAA